MIAFRHQICKMKDRPFFDYSLAIFFTMFFDEGLNSVHLSEQLATLSRYQKSIVKQRQNNRSKM